MEDRDSALELGARAERGLRHADQLQVVPGAYALAEIQATLAQVVQADPSLGDPYWDLAVVQARFIGDFDLAAQSLAAARERDYTHPLMDRLEALIANRPQLPPAPTDAATRLYRLLLDLTVQAESRSEPLLHDDATGLPSADPAPRPASFGQYLQEARALCAGGEIDEDQLLQALAATTGMAGDTREYAQDLLRRVALDLAYQTFRKAATEAHLRTLLQQSMAIFGREPRAARRARRAADRGLAALALAPWLEGSELHADFLIARGQGLYYEAAARQQEAIACYQQAYRLKQRAGNAADAARLAGLLGTQVRHWIGRARIGGAVDLEGAT